MTDKESISIINEFYRQCSGIGVPVFPCTEDALYALHRVIELAEESLEQKSKQGVK